MTSGEGPFFCLRFLGRDARGNQDLEVLPRPLSRLALPDVA